MAYYKDSEIYKNYKTEITPDNYLDSNQECIVTSNGVYYIKKTTSAGSILKGYAGTLFNPLKLTKGLSQFQDNDYFFNSKDELANVLIPSVKEFAITVYESQVKKEKTEIENNKKLQDELQELKSLEIKIKVVKEMNVPEVVGFKKLVISSETEITQKGGDAQLFNFLKIDTFLKDFRSKIIEDQMSLNSLVDFALLEDMMIKEAQRNDIGKSIEKLQDFSSALNGGRPVSLEGKVRMLFDIGDRLCPHMENRIMTLNYFNEIASAMVVFYLSDKKILYFDIYEAFEKLGVFDSSWQKNVLSKLESIDKNLSALNDQLAELNSNFINLVNSSNEISEQLKQLNSKIDTNNMLQTITAFQTWRINQNIKRLSN